MSPPTSNHFVVVDIPNAGRGVIASTSISAGEEVLRSDPAAAHVTFRQYRKEVCARCFQYNLGRNLPFKHASTGKVFCAERCREDWISDEGDLGVAAWEGLHSFVQARTKDVANCYECLPDRGERPDRQEIEQAWHTADEQVGLPLAKSTAVKANNVKVVVEPDILGYLLCAVLSYHSHPSKWRDQVTELAMDDEPYRSTHELSNHTESFLQLSRLLPKALLPSCTSDLCHQAVAAASHNSFGIRSEDGEEYMGYALYPSASYFNHCCAPNIKKVRVGREWVFTAARDIEPGEECCITYLGGDEREMSVQERRARLEEHWGFLCTCQRCTTEGG